MSEAAKPPGQRAYEEDVRRCPNYHDGAARHTWAQLDAICKWSWERDPTPREHKPRVVTICG